MPVQPWVMRPRRSTPVASTTTSEAPEFASMPRCVMCHGLGTPSLALYWHIGATTMRLASSRPLILYGENSALVISDAQVDGKLRKERGIIEGIEGEASALLC